VLNCAEFSCPKTTQKNYDSDVARGQKFLGDLVADRHENGGGDSNGIDTNLLERSFKNPANKYTVTALEWFLVQKCCTEGIGKGTAAGIQGAFADFWDNMWDPILLIFEVFTLGHLFHTNSVDCPSTGKGL
jgi:hypothetical protein